MVYHSGCCWPCIGPQLRCILRNRGTRVLETCEVVALRRRRCILYHLLGSQHITLHRTSDALHAGYPGCFHTERSATHVAQLNCIENPYVDTSGPWLPTYPCPCIPYPRLFIPHKLRRRRSVDMNTASGDLGRGHTTTASHRWEQNKDMHFKQGYKVSARQSWRNVVWGLQIVRRRESRRRRGVIMDTRGRR